MSRLISQEAMSHFENAVYLPLLLTILNRDKEIIENSPIKLKRPYLNIIEQALNIVQKDLTSTSKYLRNNKMRLEKGKSDNSFTEYILFHNGYEDTRRYLNIRLRNRSEELLSFYLSKGSAA